MKTEFVLLSLLLLSDVELCVRASDPCGVRERLLALEGGEASLPCQVRFDREVAQFMMWSVRLTQRHPKKLKASSKLSKQARVPAELMYRLDGGNSTIDSASVWKDSRWAHKARFSLLNSELHLINLNFSDSGIYSCDVRFADGRWRNCSTPLFVQVPLPPPLMEINHEIISLNETTIGPYAEREFLNATCSLSHPYSYLVWYNWTLNGSWLEPTGHELHLGPLNRSHFMRNLCCVVSSASSTRPSSICAQLLINLGAESVSIRAWHSPLVLGIPQEIECEVHGGFPPPEISWYLNDEAYSNVIFYDSSQLWAMSVIVLTPEEKHMGARLECRAENRNAGEYKSQFIRLDIKYKPDVTLKIGQGLNATGINAGSDVYLECSVQDIFINQFQTKANSSKSSHLITWKHNGKILKSNRTAGVLITDRYLVLRNVQKRHRGHYTCQVQNTALQMGTEDVMSSPLLLVIHYSPRCAAASAQKSYVEKGKKALLACPVDMQPWNKFARVYWSVLGEDNFTRTNHLETVISEQMLEQSEVLCWGENKLGSGRQTPCRLQLLEKDGSSDIAASSVHHEIIRLMECTVHNVTTRAILIGCENFNNDFVNFTVVADLIRDRQIVNTAQLSYTRAWHWISYLQPSTEYVIDFHLVRNADHVKADLEKLSNFSGTLIDGGQSVRTLALQIAPYLKNSPAEEDAAANPDLNAFRVHTRTLDKDFEVVDLSASLFNFETARVALYTAICLLSLCATISVCYLSSGGRRGASASRQVHIPKDPTPLRFTTSSL